VLFGVSSLVTAFVLGAWLWTSRYPPKPAALPSSAAAPASMAAFLAKLAGLPIKGPAPKTGYARSLFGIATCANVNRTDKAVVGRDMRCWEGRTPRKKEVG
jgi:hypothetical protein